MKKLLSNKGVSTGLSFTSLVIFMSVAQRYGFTDAAWRRAFITGAAVVLCLLAVFAVFRVKCRDILFASALLLVSGAMAFILELAPMVAAYKRFQGSVFMLWYLLVRGVFAFAPGLIAGFVRDPYARIPVRAAVCGTAVFAWSLCFSGLMVSIVLPVVLMTAGLYPFEGRD